MARTYSAYEAKAKFSELLRRVRGGERVVISYQGEDVAEIRPLESPDDTESRLRALEERGVLVPSRGKGVLKALARAPGALDRFLETRD